MEKGKWVCGRIRCTRPGLAIVVSWANTALSQYAVVVVVRSARSAGYADPKRCYASVMVFSLRGFVAWFA